MERHEATRSAATSSPPKSKAASPFALPPSGVQITAPCKAGEERRASLLRGAELDTEVDAPPDGGAIAWRVVLGCFILASCQMGYGPAWGVLMEDLHSRTYPTVSLATLSLVGGVYNFVSSAGSMVGGRLGEQFGYKKMIAIGILLTYVSLIIASFVSSLPLLFLFQGAFLGGSLALGMPLYMALPSHWFLRRRGLATGIAVSGSGFGGAISSLIIRGLLPSLGYRRTLLIYAYVNFMFSVIAWCLLQTRLTRRVSLSAGKAVAARWLPSGIWTNPVFISWMASYFFGTFGLWSPQYYITSYTVFRCPKLDPKSLEVAVPVVSSSLGIGIGRVLTGLLADKLGVLNTVGLNLSIAGLLQIIAWPLAKSFPSIVAFAVLNAIIGSCSVSLLPVSAARLFGMDGIATIIGTGVLASSPGQLLGATVGGLILDKYGYSALAYYSGSMGIVGAIFLVGTIITTRVKGSRNQQVLPLQ